MKKIIFVLLLTLLVFVLPASAGKIHEAATKGDLVKVKALLEKDGRLLDAKGDHEKQPMHWAAQAGHQPRCHSISLPNPDSGFLFA